MITVDGNKATLCIDEFTPETYAQFLSTKLLPRYQIQANGAGFQVSFPAEYLERLGHEHIVEPEPMPFPLPDFLFDRQEVAVKVGWKKRRYALFWDAGLGKTLVFLELARQLAALGKKSLIVSPLNVISQTIETSLDFYGSDYHIINLHGRSKYAGSGPNSIPEFVADPDFNIGIINHMAFRKPVDLTGIDAIFLDESSILKNAHGTIRGNLIHCTKGIEYKYAFSATQAPNERVEYAQVACFLEAVRSDTEFLGMFFVQKENGWVLRRHRTKGFYDFLASFSMFMRDPSIYGLIDNRNLKPYREIIELIDVTPEQVSLIAETLDHSQVSLPGMAQKPNGFSERQTYNQISKGFLYVGENKAPRYVESHKSKAIRDFLLAHPDRKAIIWTVYDEEGEIIRRDLEENTSLSVVCLTGKTPVDKRAQLIDDFRHSAIDVMITKPRLLGLGLNLHHASITVFSGLADSWEAYYQALKREWRFPQQEEVLVYHPYTIYEEAILNNVLGKRDQAENDFGKQEQMYAASGYDEIAEYLKTDMVAPRKEQKLMHEPIKTDHYELYHTDSIAQMLSGWKENSVDLIVTSIPFRNDLFAYTDHVADMGNSGGVGQLGRDEFVAHLTYCLEGMLKVLKPGRLACVEIAQSPLRKGVDGIIGVSDFRGDVIRAAEQVGFFQFGDIPVLGNPQAEAIVKHITTLNMDYVRGDRTKLSPMYLDYIIVLKKPGENQVPVTSDEVTNENWIEYADGMWQEKDHNRHATMMTATKQRQRWAEYFENVGLTFLEAMQMIGGAFFDVDQTQTLNTPYTRGRTKELEDADKHVCPFSLPLVNRLIRMYSNPGETVCDPFNGVGSVVHEAVILGRFAIGIELKAEYFLQSATIAEQAVENSCRQLQLI